LGVRLINSASFKKKSARHQMTQTKLKACGILFDLDGTILDTTPAYLSAAETAFQATGQPPPPPERILLIPKRLEQRQPITDIVTIDTKKFLDVFLKTFYAIAPAKTKPMPNVTAVLEELSGKAKLSVITMRFMPKKVVQQELKQHGLDHYFTQIVTALDTVKPKPSPEALIQAGDAMAVPMCDCVIVGDSVVDVQAGKAAGVKTVAVLSGLYTREELAVAKPDFIIGNLTELPKLLA
jgi:HAD superfamily hydrolase (TIGR01509 family)